VRTRTAKTHLTRRWRRQSPTGSSRN
jgi:hypothetical protein